MVGNDSIPHLMMFGEVSKPLSAETSEIFIIGPTFRFGTLCLALSILLKNINFSFFANYQLSCFIQCRQSV